jgi:hypothetical protein
MCGSTTVMCGLNLRMIRVYFFSYFFLAGAYARFLHLTTVEFKILPEQMIVIKKDAENAVKGTGRVKNSRSMIFMAPESGAGDLESDEDEDIDVEEGEEVEVAKVDEME